MEGRSKAMPTFLLELVRSLVFGKSVRVRVAASLFGVIVPAIIVVAAGAWYQDQAARTGQERASRHQAEAVAREINASLKTVLAFTVPLAEYVQGLSGDEQRCAVLNQIGVLPRSTGRVPLLIHGQTNACASLSAGFPSPFVLGALREQLGGGAAFAIARDHVDLDRGFIALALNRDRRDLLVLSLAKDGLWSGAGSLPDAASAVTIHDQRGQILMDFGRSGVAEPDADQAGELPFLKANRDRQLSSLIPATSLLITVRYPSYPVMPIFGGSASWITVTALVVVLLVTIFAAVVAIDRTIGWWITYLSRIAVAHSRGRLTVRAGRLLEAPREIADLGNAINQMAENIAAHASMLEAAVLEKGRTLQELHHRVKNNFQIVSSLLTLQRKGVAPERAQDFRFIEDHVHAMAAAYRTAYTSADVTHVFATEIAKDIVAILCETAGFAPSSVDIRVTDDDRRVDLDRAITLGLTLAYLLPPRLDFLRAAAKPARVEIRFVDGTLTIQVMDAGMITNEGDELRHRLAKAYMRQLRLVAVPVGDHDESLLLRIPIEEVLSDAG